MPDALVHTDNKFSPAVAALDDGLAQAEAAIRSLKLGVSASIPLEDNIILVWGTFNGKGRRLFIRHPERDYDGFKSASIALRQQAAAAIPDLVELLRAFRKERATEIQATADDLLDYLATLIDATNAAEETD